MGIYVEVIRKTMFLSFWLETVFTIQSVAELYAHYLLIP